MEKKLVAIDRSDYSVTAARAAIDRAQLQPVGGIRFVHVVSLQPGELGTEEYPERPDVPEEWPVFQEPLAIAREADVSVQCEALFGNEAEMLLHHAQEENVDLIVLGSLGESGVKDFFLGSVARRVASHAPCSVMIVRHGFRLDPQFGNGMIRA